MILESPLPSIIFCNSPFVDFVLFCSICLQKTDKGPPYNEGMKMTDKYIPREYLSLKINYCRQQLEMLPEVKLLTHNISGKDVKRLSVGNHRYNLDSENGKEQYNLWLRRDQLTRDLQVYEAIWKSNFLGNTLTECEPHKVNRSLFVDYKNKVTMNKAFFDSLENDSNTKYIKYKNYYFDGTFYRSAAEKDIAILYTELGIPFKYEPTLTIKGVPVPINPDFIIYIEELDNCKIHEHLGIKEAAEYFKTTKIKYSNYTEAGLIPGTDILFTYDNDEIPFDIRDFLGKLNSSIYGTTIATK